MTTTDKRIKQDVLDELDWDPLVNATAIGVAVTDGAVTLDGTVQTYAAKRAAVAATRRVKGVLALADEIEVLLPGLQSTSDDEIAKKLAHVIEWNVNLPDDSVMAKVDDGHVVLTGQVDTLAQKRLVEQNASVVRGVKSVYNDIAVTAQPERRDVSKRINDALHRRARLEAKNVKIEVEGETVRLSGKVSDLAERRMIEEAVWATPGIAVLDDRLTVG